MATPSPDRSSLARYSVAVGATLAMTLIRWLLDPLLGGDQPLLLFTLGITLAGWWGGLGPALLATALSLILGTWAFLDPIYSFQIHSTPDITRLVLLTVIGIAISFLSETKYRAVWRAHDRENARERTTQHLDALVDTVSLLLRKESPESAVDELCRRVMAALDCQIFVNYLVDPKTGKLHLNAQAGLDEPAASQAAVLSPGEAVCGCVVRDRQSIVLNESNIKDDPRSTIVRAAGVRAYACNPLMIGDRCLGSISFGTRSRPEFSSEELALMRTITDHVAIAMQRKLNREDLRASQERYRAFVTTSLEAIWRIEFDSPIDTKLPVDAQVAQIFERGYYAEANDALARLYGWEKAEDVVGLRVNKAESMEHEPTLQSYRQFIASDYKRMGEISFERDRHGGMKHFLNSYVGIVEEGRLVRIWGSSLDVTEGKRAEAALIKQTALLHGVTQSMTDVVFAKDAEGRFTFANPTALTVMGRPEPEIIGHTVLEWLENKEEARALAENDKRVIADGKSITFEERFRNRLYDSKKSPLRDASGAIVGLVGVARDMTELKQTQGALRESEQRFRLMADSAPVLIWLAESEKGFTWFNQQWLTFTGRDLLQELGEGWFDNIHPEDAARCRHLFQSARERHAAFQLDFRLRRGDGQYRWVLTQGVPRFGQEGEYLGHIGTCVDITNRKEIEEQLLRAKVAAEAANQSKDDFLAALSHELRTPLTPVLLLASEAMKDESLDEERRDDWQTVHKNVTLEARLVDDLLDLTRIARGKLSLQLQTLDAHTVISDAVNTVRPAADAKRLKVTVDLDARERWVRGDAARLQQVFWNVLQNAVKFTPGGGAIFVQTRNLDPSGRLLIEIGDTGIGLTPDEMERVFETFTQGEHANNRNTAFGGLGLGLAITRELLQMHSGRISVSSAGRNRGAIFTIELPVENEEEGKGGSVD
jgi:PAS domain S-box-containing protein